MSLLKHNIEMPKHKMPVNEEIELHKKGWVIQRIGWVLLALFLVAAVAGVFGDGPISKSEIHSGNVKIEYQKFGRYEHDTELKFSSSQESIRDIGLSAIYAGNMKITGIIPSPDSQVTRSGMIFYHFNGEQVGNVVFFLDPGEFGNQQATVMINNRRLSIHQTIYP